MNTLLTNAQSSSLQQDVINGLRRQAENIGRDNNVSAKNMLVVWFSDHAGLCRYFDDEKNVERYLLSATNKD